MHLRQCFMSLLTALAMVCVDLCNAFCPQDCESSQCWVKVHEQYQCKCKHRFYVTTRWLRWAFQYLYIRNGKAERIIMKNSDGCVCDRLVKILLYSLVEVSVCSLSLIERKAAAIFV